MDSHGGIGKPGMYIRIDFVMDDSKLIMMLGRQVIVVVSSSQLVAETILVRSFQIVRTLA